MTWRSTGIAWLVATLLVFMAWWVRGVKLESDSGLAPRRVFANGSLDVDAVDRLMITRENGEELIFRRTEEGWRQASPFDVAADGLSVRDLLVAIADLESSRSFEASELPAGTTAEQLGLDPPLAVLERNQRR